MAAGKGARMRSSRPKVLHRIAGVPMVSYAASAAGRVDPASVVLVVPPESREAIAGELGGDFEYVEQPDPLGTGHALATALERVPFKTRHLLLLNGDMPLLTGAAVAELAALHIDRKAAISLITAVLPAADAHDLGTLKRGARGKPLAIIEASEEAFARNATIEVSVGAYAIDASWVRGVVSELEPHPSGEYFVTDLIARAVADGQRVEAMVIPWTEGPIGVNTRSQLAQAELAIQRRLRESAMEGGATLTDPDTVYLDASVVLEQDVTVLPNTSLRGTTRIASGAIIGPNAQINDSQIGRDVVVTSAIVDSATLDAGSHVGPFSHLRAGTHLAEGAYVGSHAEVKASTVGRRSHVGHFAYVGDTVMGDDVNIGAGTVTCNFDGTTKHVTRIGDRVFIGSGSMLVAPLEIGDDALTGAGAVVNRDVAPGERVVGVPARSISSRGGIGKTVGSEEGASLG
jgi:bifunctional UDP-N-acetylglucosamine pyrophosphorylase/glucosamine-1-phosphate N-acetyltransferase